MQYTMILIFTIRTVVRYTILHRTILLHYWQAADGSGAALDAQLLMKTALIIIQMMIMILVIVVVMMILLLLLLLITMIAKFPL